MENPDWAQSHSLSNLQGAFMAAMGKAQASVHTTIEDGDPVAMVLIGPTIKSLLPPHLQADFHSAMPKLKTWGD
jgi:hypothetical protein